MPLQSKEIRIPYQEGNPDDLPEDEKTLVAATWSARRSAHSPHYHFKVGAAVRTTTGEIFLGSNQENPSADASHAERVALNKAFTAGFRGKIDKIAIAGAPESIDPSVIPETPEEPTPPCGHCCQDIIEAEACGEGKITIIFASRNLVRRVVGAENLLAFTFGQSNLASPQ